MAISLYSHNREAYEAAVSMLNETGKAAVIHPTGTGKSFIGFKYCEDHPEQRVCWLSPSEYIFRTQLENLRRAASPAPAAPSSLHSELSTLNLKNIVFLTYARLMQMSEEERSAIAPDVIILDEFHRAGARQWGLGVQKLLQQYPEARLLGLTATNIRYLDGQRDMADELFDGHIASEMSLGEAIVRGILPAPKYVLSIYRYKDDLAKYELRARKAKSRAARDAAEEILEKLRRALDQAVGMDALFEKHMEDRHGKYLVFCANAEHMNDMMRHVPDWFSGVDAHPHVYSAYSEDPATEQAFADFKADTSSHLKLLFCIDMLNEGIHVDDVSGVILLRPTVSPIIYKQQIGRALSTNKAGSPIIFDVVLNIENLYSISSLQEEMDVAVTYYRDRGWQDDFVDSFEVIDEVHDCLELFDRLNDTLTASWDLMYEQAQKYCREYGSLNVSNRYCTEEGYSLGRWLETQRRVRNGSMKGSLTSAQIEKLDALGMRWESVSDLSWEKNYAAALRYAAAHGDLQVKARYVDEEGIALGSWIMNLRCSRKSGIRNGYLTPERIRKLDALGMTWDVPDYLFESYYASALAYYRLNGDLDVPSQYVDGNGVRLGCWIHGLRRKKRMGKLSLSEEQTERLNRLGMIWLTKNEALWENGFRHAEAYSRTHHDLNVDAACCSPDGYRLGDWIADQREKQLAGTMKEERRERLDALGMVWERPDPWETRYALAEAYYREHGNLNIPGDYKTEGIWLGKWLNEQRQMRNGNRKKQLTEAQIARLDAIGMTWEKRSKAAWDEAYREAAAWKAEHGNLDIPKDCVSQSGIRLRRWLSDQKRKAAAGTLEPERAAKIASLGEKPDSFESWLHTAEQYRREFGDLNVPTGYETPDHRKLGLWISNLRQDRKNGTLTLKEDQIRKLDNLGMIWGNQYDLAWDEAFGELEKYRDDHQTLKLPFNYTTPTGLNLERWLYQQRKNNGKGILKPDRKVRLDTLSPTWSQK